MNEAWRTRSDALRNEKTKDVSILDEAVTGAMSADDIPDSLFYSEFGEEDAYSFFDIFEKFKETYEIDRQVAIKTLEDHLEEQIYSMPNGICPIEVVLYASRCAHDIINSDENVFKKIRNIVIRFLKVTPDPDKIAKYILRGWEWAQQIGIFIESIGCVNDTALVDLAMSAYDDIAEKFNDESDSRIYKSYVNMLFSAQNEEYFPYIADVVTRAEFMKNRELVQFFVDKCKKTPFIMTELNLTDIIREITLHKGVDPDFAMRISHIKPRSKSVNPDVKQVYTEEDINDLQFGTLTARYLFACESLKDPELCIAACKKVMVCIDEMYPPEQRGNAYILLGTKGRWNAEETVTFLLKQRDMYPDYLAPINIALFCHKQITMRDFFYSLINSRYVPVWNKNIGGKYFRYDKTAFADGFIPCLVSYVAENASSEPALTNVLHIANGIIAAYNGKNGKLGDNSAVTDELLDMAEGLCGNYADKQIYTELVEMLELIIGVCPSKKKRILACADAIYKRIENRADMFSVKCRIDDMIKHGDELSEPD